MSKECIELDAILELAEFFGEHATVDNPYGDGCMAVRVSDIESLPIADAVEVCRCDSCENWDTDWDSATGKNVHFCPIVAKMTPPNWFCADGEPREK